MISGNQRIWLILLFLAVIGCSESKWVIPQLEQRSSRHLYFESDNGASLIAYKGFVVRYDTLHKVPAFTIQHITPQQVSDSLGHKAQRKNVFWVDDKLEPFSATKADYYKSGYDRGHHAPAGDFVYSQALKDESFVFTNISPQQPDLNRGALVKLEKRIRERIIHWQSEAYVITGTLFLKAPPDTIGEGLTVPSHIYKLVFYPQKKRMYAYIFPNYLKFYSDDLKRYRTTVDDIEIQCGEDFFDRLADETENKLESSKRNI